VTARSKARKRALDVLYEAEVRGHTVEAVIARRATADPDPAIPALTAYSLELARGVAEQRTTVDTLIAASAQGWALERMPAIDRNLLRIGVWELLHAHDVPTAVVISEAVSLAADLSTEESPSWVNGLLATIAREHPRVSTTLQGGAGLGGEDAPVDELFGEGPRAGVVDHREGEEVLDADGQ
jgi:N utilization substance protein B